MLLNRKEYLLTDLQRNVIEMLNVCVPRRVEDDTPFNGQSVYIYAYDPYERDTVDGYCWNESVYNEGEFVVKQASDILFWSPVIWFHERIDVHINLKMLMDGYVGLNKAGLCAMQFTFFAVKYPDPRIMTLPDYDKQGDYYFPRTITPSTKLSVFTPVYGYYEGAQRWWQFGDEVEDISYYMPDMRLELELLDGLFGEP